MAKYRKHFELDPNDVDLIENALRKQIALNTVKPNNTEHDYERGSLMDIQSLLGKLHDQKIFYSQVNIDNHPRG